MRGSRPDIGEDATPDSVIAPDGRVVQILTGAQEHHISADIAYAVWQYWQATADEAFLVSAGADILIEAARFLGDSRSLGIGRPLSYPRRYRSR
jgi:trehalose/maltose hydrolase-like predicted phosphorylase